MIDPEEQLRRLAEGRSEVVEPFEADEIDRPDAANAPGHLADVIPLPMRRRVVAAAAAAVIVIAVGAGVLALVTAAGDDDSEFVGEIPVDQSTDDADDSSTGDATAVAGSDVSTSTTVPPSAVSIPDVIGDDVEEASAALAEAGVPFEIEPAYVKEPGRVGEVVGVIESPPTEPQVEADRVVQVFVAHLAAATLATDPCTRPAHLLGDVDDDQLVDRIYPRVTDGRITAVEVCTGVGERIVADGLDLHRLEQVIDLDDDGRDEIVATVDEFGVESRVLSLSIDELVIWPTVLRFGTAADGDGATTWWGCASFAVGEPPRAASGTVASSGELTTWTLTEVRAPAGAADDAVVQRPLVGDGPSGPPGDARCRVPAEAPGPCAVADLDVAMIGDVDGDGNDDLVSPRDGIACLLGAEPVVVELGAVAADAGTWFLDDIEDDGALELFLGRITEDALEVRPYRIGRDGSIEPAADDDCCVQTEPVAAGPVDAVPSAVTGPVVTARWFSCVAGRDGAPGELVSGRYWIDREPPNDASGEPARRGVIRWTIDVGSEASADITYRTEFDDSDATDAWIPGNGCRNSAGVWRPPVEIELGDDWSATPISIEAFNQSIISDDPARRVVRLREALDVASAVRGSSGPYREDVAEGFFEIWGSPDDSSQALRWDYEFSDDGVMLESVALSWVCAPGRGHDDFSTEPCL